MPSVAIGVYAQRLAFQLRAGRAVVEVAHGHHHEAKGQFGHGVGVLSGRVHYAYAVGGGGVEVHVVIAGPGADNDLQLLGGIEHLGVHHIAADDEGVGVGYCCEQFCFFAIFLQQGQFITGCFYLFADAVHGNFGERLIGCD